MRNTSRPFHVRTLMLLVALLAPLNAWSLELDAAKAQGLVGEQADGYLGIVTSSPSAEVTVLVNDVNTKRRAQYERIAQKNGITLGDVEALAGQKTIDKTKPGNYVRPAGAGWQKK